MTDISPKELWWTLRDKWKDPKCQIGKTSVRHKGKTYRRWKAGYSPTERKEQKSTGDKTLVWCECGKDYGQYHELGCDCEQCPVCRGQLLSCGHRDLFRYPECR